MTAREELFDKLCAMVPDINTRSKMYIILDKYEITKRETAIALLEADRNEYLLKSFIVAKTVKGCTNRTLKVYSDSIRFFLRYMGKTVDDITTEDVRLYTAKRIYQDRVSKTTAGNEIRYLRSFFGYLYSEELIKKNPMNRIETIKREKTKKEAFEDIELEKMRSVLQTNREKAIFEILLSTGCRVNELVNIKLSEINGNEILIHGKGQKDRTVYLNAKASFAMDSYLSERRDTNPYLFAGGVYKEAMYKNMNKNWYKEPHLVHPENYLNLSSVESLIRKIGRKTDVHAYPHKFRRTCATFALRRGMPIEQVSKMLGHESIETTQIYLDLSERDLKEAHRKFVI